MALHLNLTLGYFAACQYKYRKYPEPSHRSSKLQTLLVIERFFDPCASLPSAWSRRHSGFRDRERFVSPAEQRRLKVEGKVHFPPNCRRSSKPFSYSARLGHRLADASVAPLELAVACLSKSAPAHMRAESHARSAAQPAELRAFGPYRQSTFSGVSPNDDFASAQLAACAARRHPQERAR